MKFYTICDIISLLENFIIHSNVSSLIMQASWMLIVMMVMMIMFIIMQYVLISLASYPFCVCLYGVVLRHENNFTFSIFHNHQCVNISLAPSTLSPSLPYTALCRYNSNVAVETFSVMYVGHFRSSVEPVG